MKLKSGTVTMFTDHNWQDTNDGKRSCTVCGTVRDKPSSPAVTMAAVLSVSGASIIAVFLFFIFKRIPI